MADSKRIKKISIQETSRYLKCGSLKIDVIGESARDVKRLFDNTEYQHFYISGKNVGCSNARQLAWR
jgi:hypothetical protein